MNTLEIQERLSQSLTVEVVVVPLDRIPPPTYPAAYVINFDTANLPGTHWCLVCLHHDQSVTFFDPLCIEPIPSLLLHWFAGLSRVAMNKKAVQHPLSATCGAHVIFVAESHFLHGVPIKEILDSLYTPSLLENDSMVTKYCLQIKK